MPFVPGITRSALWAAWKQVRKLVRDHTLRDVVDFLEYDVDPDIWINRLIREVRSGRYEPEFPRRLRVAKSKGLSRTITIAHIPDIVLYRALADRLYARVKRYEHRHAYFERGKTPEPLRSVIAAKKTSELLTWESLLSLDEPYRSPESRRRFRAWLCFDQYRKFLVFNRVYPYIVTTDISNFFDSVLYSQLLPVLQRARFSAPETGLLLFLLERLSIRHPYAECPRIGLPVDECECSRKLAHVLLFPHDREMVKAVGPNAYVRWMDDQDIGVQTRAEAIAAIARLGASLASLHLTPNSGKTRILSLTAARRHFHLDVNKRLDGIALDAPKTNKERRKLGKAVRSIWRVAAPYADEGEWDKILKRFYMLAGRAGARFLRRLALPHMLLYPTIASRIAEYIRCTGSATEYVDFLEAITKHPEQQYEDVNVCLLEESLRLEPDTACAKHLRELSIAVLKGTVSFPGRLNCEEVACLMLLRYGDRRFLPHLRAAIKLSIQGRRDVSLARSASIVLSSYGISDFRHVRSELARLGRSTLGLAVSLIAKLLTWTSVPDRFKARLDLRYDSMCQVPFVDTRSLLTARLLGLNSHASVTGWLASNRAMWKSKPISNYDRGLIERLHP